MNKKQEAIAKSMEKLLLRMHKAGLQGGVYDSIFCIWPTSKNNLINRDFGGSFFEDIEKHGAIIYVPTVLDGGAGV